MNSIFFRPWVGSAYTTGVIFGKRVMILGESHYCEEGCTDCGNARVPSTRHLYPVCWRVSTLNPAGQSC